MRHILSLGKAALGGFIALLFFGAIFWAKGRDPFQRIWFEVKARGHDDTECIAVLPKMAARPLPVVVYLHGSGGSLLGDGNELRQMAEMGLAAVGMDYEEKTESRKQKAEIERPSTGDSKERTEDDFDAEFSALLNYLRRQPWADTKRVAWVGFSLGAQRSLAYALRHPDLRPELLVRLAGGWIPQLEQFKAQGSPASPSTLSPQPSTAFLLIHGERDEVFPLAQAQQVAACLQTNGVPVELRVLPGEGHSFGANRLLVFRVVGEQCLTRLKGPGALRNYRSILSWQAQAKPLWLFWTPALLWATICLWLRRRVVSRSSRTSAPATSLGVAASRQSAANRREESQRRSAETPLRGWEIGLRWVAALLAAAALAQTALHLVPPRLPISERTLSVARKHLVSPKERSDFEFLAAKPCWSGKRLRILLEHVELANYNRELINWKLDERIYREFVLSPQIDPAADGNLDWRRPLWENFYPRIRKEQDPEAAAEIIVRFLRERVTIAEGDGFPAEVAGIWQGQITNERGFEAVYVAALRSAGVPARLDARRRAELWTGSAWQTAPRPLVESGEWSGWRR